MLFHNQSGKEIPCHLEGNAGIGVGQWVNSARISLEDHSQCEQTTVHSSGSTPLKNQKSRWQGGWNLLQSMTSKFKKHTDADALSRLPGQPYRC